MKNTKDFNNGVILENSIKMLQDLREESLDFFFQTPNPPEVASLKEVSYEEFLSIILKDPKNHYVIHYNPDDHNLTLSYTDSLEPLKEFFSYDLPSWYIQSKNFSVIFVIY